MDPRKRKEILGQWGVAAGETVELRETQGDRAVRDVLGRDLAESPLKGKPLRQRLRNFRPSVDNYVVSLGGPRAYMLRLREIEDETAAHERQLAAEWHALAVEAAGDAEVFARRWHEEAARLRFDAVNELIDRHNRFYPVEARLPMDPRTRDFALVNGLPYRREPLGERWLLERFPPVLAAALEARPEGAGAAQERSGRDSAPRS